MCCSTLFMYFYYQDMYLNSVFMRVNVTHTYMHKHSHTHPRTCTCTRAHTLEHAHTLVHAHMTTQGHTHTCPHIAIQLHTQIGQQLYVLNAVMSGRAKSPQTPIMKEATFFTFMSIAIFYGIHIVKKKTLPLMFTE